MNISIPEGWIEPITILAGLKTAELSRTEPENVLASKLVVKPRTSFKAGRPPICMFLHPDYMNGNNE